MAHLRKRILTPRLIEKLGGRGIGGRLEIGDSYCPGLLLRVTERGVKSFSVIYRVAGEGGLSASGRPRGGKQHRITLGQWPIIDLVTAREKAREIRIAAGSGRDPRLDRRNEITKLVTNNVSAVIDRYIDRQAKPSILNWKNVESLLKRIVVPEWGNRPMVEITRTDAHALLDKVAEERGPKMAQSVKRDTGRLFSWAVDREIVSANPFHRMDRPNDEKYQPRERHLSDAELKLIWNGCEELGYPYGPAIRLLILTGLRRGNISSSCWSWIDTKERLLTVPKSEYKSRRIHELPFSDKAWEIVETLPRFNSCEWLFRAARGDGHIDGWSPMRQRLCDIIKANNSGAAIPLWTIHDLRHTVKTGLSRLRVNSDIKDRVLGHAKKGMDAVYDHHDYRDEKREALELWAKHIAGLLK
jgi:integrase